MFKVAAIRPNSKVRSATEAACASNDRKVKQGLRATRALGSGQAPSHDSGAPDQQVPGFLGRHLVIPEPKVLPGPDLLPPTGETSVEALVRIRRGQDFFRRAVLASYGGQRCMSGIAEPSLLLASHIVPWASDAVNRLNPSNGLCLSALHDRAFDKGLLGVDTDYRVRVSPVLRDQGGNALARTWLLDLDGARIRLPERLLPDREFLAWHMGTLFQAG